MIEIRAGETKSPAIACEEDPRSPAEIFATFIAVRVPVRNEDTQIARGLSDAGGVTPDLNNMISIRTWTRTSRHGINDSARPHPDAARPASA
jgi:hypothetical protein